MNSLLLACRKRRIPIEDLRAAVQRIERDLFIEADEEVPTQAIGERVLRELRRIDQVAYVRFASVYRDFETLDDFIGIVNDVSGRATIAV